MLRRMNEQLTNRLRQRLWEEPASTRHATRWLLWVGRYLFALVRDLAAGDLSMRAMSLVYTTLLSIVPLLALAFSVLKAMGVHNSLAPVLNEFLRPLGPQGHELSENIIGFVERVQVSVLGFFGVSVLFYTAFSLIQKVEASFNFIWRVKQTRPFAQRVGGYLGVLMVGPFTVFSALGLTAAVLNSDVVLRLAEIQPLGHLIYLVTRLIPYLLIIGVFCFMYLFMPNTRVRWTAALSGALASGILWQSASLAFASFASGATNYNAIYSSFAILIFLLIWLYLGWLIMLIGCQLAFYIQNPQYLLPSDDARLMGRDAELLALQVMALAGQRFIAGERPMDRDELAAELETEPGHVAQAVESLIRGGFLTETGIDGNRLTPARDLDTITLSELWTAIRRRPAGSAAGVGRYSPQVKNLLDEMERHFHQASGGLSLKAWLTQSKPRTPTHNGNCQAAPPRE